MNSSPVQDATLLALLASRAGFLALTLPSWHLQLAQELTQAESEGSSSELPRELPRELSRDSLQAASCPPLLDLADLDLLAAADFTDQTEWDAEWEQDTEWETALPAALRLSLPQFSASSSDSSSASGPMPEAPLKAPLKAPLGNSSVALSVRRSITAQIMELLGSYQTCRIWVDRPPRRLFAMQMGQQYYSFFRLLPTRAAALKLADRLSQVQLSQTQLSQAANQILITAAEPEVVEQASAPAAYAVWLWQPEANLAE